MDRQVLLSIIILVLVSNTLFVEQMTTSSPLLSASLSTHPTQFYAMPSSAESGPQIVPILGVVRVLVVAVAFPDVKPTLSITQLRKEWFGTVPTYYHEISYGKLTIQGDIYGWYTLPHPELHYGKDCKSIDDSNCSGVNQSWLIANDTVALASKDVNFANYDYYVFIHSGTGEETSGVKNDVWSVTYLGASIQAGSKILTKFSIVSELEAQPNVPNGMWCVEFAHNLAIPDLYNSTNGPNHGKSILGPWDLMDKGSWNGDPPGSLPAHMSAWEKIELGFMSGSTLATAQPGSSTFTIDPTEVPSNNVHIVKVPASDAVNPSQYYLVEVREQIGFDAALPGQGVLITYVDENQPVGKVRLINSDPGTPDLTDAAWRTGETFTDSAHGLSIQVTGQTGSSYQVTVTRSAVSAAISSPSSSNSTTRIFVAGVTLTVRLAISLTAQEKGLSGIPSLPEDEGMLFVFSREDYWTFWMNNMSFPLDIIWFNSNHQVVWTEPDLRPCSPSSCLDITPSVASMYVLEVNAGFIAAHHIVLGTTFTFLTS